MRKDDFDYQIKNAKYKHNLYILGTFEKRITVYSQQIRAINLVYSLSKKKAFNSGTKIGIIGGGVAGITAALSAACLGAQVKLFEKGSLLNLWSECKVRKIHPNLFDWPTSNWQDSRTNLPFLNWEYNVASDISKTLLSEFRMYVNKLDNLNVEEFKKACLVENEHSYSIFVIEKDQTINYDYDYIILCIGFGHDGSLSFNKIDVTRSYWANDNIDKYFDPIRKFVISGVGDGGIADALRIRLKNFSYSTYRDLLSDKKLIDYIADWESKIADHEDNQEKISEIFETYYTDKKLHQISRKIDKKIEGNFRTDTELVLVSRTETIYNPYSFPLNRFLLSRLIHLDKSKTTVILNTDISEFEKHDHLSFWVKFNKDVLITDDLIFRRGTTNPFFEECQISWDQKLFDKLKSINTLNLSWQNRVFSNSDFINCSSKIKKQYFDEAASNGVARLNFVTWLISTIYSKPESKAIEIESKGIGYVSCGKSVVISKPVSKNGFTKIKMIRKVTENQNVITDDSILIKDYATDKLKASVYLITSEMTDDLELKLFYNELKFSDVHPYLKEISTNKSFFDKILNQTFSTEDLIYRTKRILVTHNLLILKNQETNIHEVIFVLRNNPNQVKYEPLKWGISYEEQYDIVDRNNIEKTISRGLKEEFGIDRSDIDHISTHGLFIESDNLNLAILGLVVIKSNTENFKKMIKNAVDGEESLAVIGVNINEAVNYLDNMDDKNRGFDFINSSNYYKSNRYALGKIYNHEFHSSAKIRLALAKWLLESSDILTKLDLNLDETSKGEN